ncbi:MAG: type II toxin-antitoxin system RelE/ParE family toxin [bacterium]|nr:type II toxin-antitoxin system RelE/ParE family toxin [bacterium]
MYRLSRTAEDDVIAIYLTGAGLFGVGQAERYHQGLEETFRFLSAFPKAARLRNEIAPPVRVHPYRSHIIVYTVVGQDIDILRVRHGLEDWDSAL